MYPLHPLLNALLSTQPGNAKAHRTVAWVLVGLVGLYGLGYALWGTITPVLHGYDYDGDSYGKMAQAFPHHWQRQDISTFHMQRLLPSAPLYYMYALLGIPHSTANVVAGFLAVMVACQMAAAWLWARLGRGQGWSPRTVFVTGVGVVASFGLLKAFYYRPVVVDGVAWLLAVLAAEAFLNRAPARLLLVLALAPFCWPSLGPVVLALLALGRPPATPAQAGQPGRLGVLPYVGALGVALAWVLWGEYVYYIWGQKTGMDGTWPINPRLLPWAAWALGVAMFAHLWPLLDHDRLLRPRAWWASLNLGWAVLGLLVLWGAGQLFGLGYTSAHAPHLGDPMRYARQFVLYSLVWPGIGPLDHLQFYGFAALAGVWALPALYRRLRQLGLGATLVFGLAAIMWLKAEARHSLGLMPLALALVLPALQPDKWHPRKVALWVGLVLLFSKVWYPLGLASHAPTADPFALPMQHYVGHSGHFMSPMFYLGHLLWVGLGLAAGWWWFRPPRPAAKA